MDWHEHITSDPQIAHGQPCVRGTRVAVSVVLDNLADGESPGVIAESYHIPEAAVSACLRYAAELAHGRVTPLPAAPAV
ncbi:MAG: DUF433 domain-containing protein [Planctomycetota bacterium]